MQTHIVGIRKRLGDSKPYTLRAMAAAIPEAVQFDGWRVGTGVWKDPPEARISLPAVTTVVVYLTVAGEFYATFDQVPQEGSPQFERWPYKDIALWIAGPLDTLESLRERLYQLRPTEREATDAAIAEAQTTLLIT